jgi:hypothetical protein
MGRNLVERSAARALVVNWQISRNFLCSSNMSSSEFVLGFVD